MNTKIFLIDEHKETIFDGEKIEEWKALISELGMCEQEKLIKEGNDVSPIPFPVMMEVEQTILTSILDTHVNYKQFGGEAVPLQILSIIALCEKEKYFENIEIWYSRQNPDPLVIGKNFASNEDKLKDYSWRMVHYKIAQWGLKFEPLTKLLPAWNKYRMAEIEQEHDRKLKELENQTNKFNFQLASYKE